MSLEFVIIQLPLLALFLVFSFGLAVPTNHIGSGEEIEQFQAFIKPRIYPNNSQVHNFISNQVYAKRWLQDNHFNLELATEKFMHHLAWRHAEKIDSIHLEDWTFFQQEYPQFINTWNQSEMLVAELWLSDWNVRRAVLSGLTRKLLRWMTYLLEMSEREFFKIRSEADMIITSAVKIIDMEGFNSRQHGCFGCAPVYTELSHLWETHYPGIWQMVYMINVGPSFRTFLSMGNTLNYDPNKVLRLYTNRGEWQPVLDREVNRKLRSRRYGGYIDRASAGE